MFAEDAGRPVAGSLHFLGEKALFGRYWGATADLPFVHLELCYYRAIEFAIERGLSRVEAGAQGEHKVRRGYLPHWTYSAHRLEHEGFFQLVTEALGREAEVLEGHRRELLDASPFRTSSCG